MKAKQKSFFILLFFSFTITFSISCGSGSSGGDPANAKLSLLALNSKLKSMQGSVNFERGVYKQRLKEGIETIWIENLNTGRMAYAELSSDRTFEIRAEPGLYSLTAFSSDQSEIKKILYVTEESPQEFIMDRESTFVAMYFERQVIDTGDSSIKGKYEPTFLVKTLEEMKSVHKMLVAFDTVEYSERRKR